MKILVDKMPEKPYECPYCKDESNMDFDKYICKWNSSNRTCYNTADCPFFKHVLSSESIREVINILISDALDAHESSYDHEPNWVTACDEE